MISTVERRLRRSVREHQGSMAPSLWPSARKGRNDDLRQLRACLPDVDRPIEWDNEASCAGYSIVNMLKNSEKPQSTLSARVKEMARGLRRSKGRAGGRVAFNLEHVAEIPAVRCACDGEDAEDAATAGRPSTATFLSALPRPAAGSMLCCVAEGDGEDLAEHGEGDSVCSADGTVLGCDRTSGSSQDLYFDGLEAEGESCTSCGSIQ